MKIIFNNKWFNVLFPKYTSIEEILEITVDTNSRSEFQHNYKSFYKLLHILGNTVCDVLFGEANTHKYKDFNSVYAINKIRSKYKNIGELYVKFIKENIKAEFLDYVCDIYDIIYSYVPAFLKMMGINDEGVSNIRPKYSINDNELKMLTDSLRLHVSSDYLYEFMS